MYFLILANDRPGMLARRLDHRPRHLAYWTGLGDCLKVAGAMLDGDGPDAQPTGSSFLLEASDEAAARALILADPFMTEGIFADALMVQPIRPALGVWRQG